MSTDQETAIPPDFWDWSLSAYDQSGVADMMLSLQDEHGLDVNLILWCFWAGKFYPGLQEEDVKKLLLSTQEWQQKVTVPLRTIRRDMKSIETEIPAKDVKKLRRDVKGLELETEKLEQKFLSTATTALPRDTVELQEACLIYFQNYQSLCIRLDQDRDLSLERLAERETELFLSAKSLIFQQDDMHSND